MSEFLFVDGQRVFRLPEEGIHELTDVGRSGLPDSLRWACQTAMRSPAIFVALGHDFRRWIRWWTFLRSPAGIMRVALAEVGCRQCDWVGVGALAGGVDEYAGVLREPLLRRAVDGAWARPRAPCPRCGMAFSRPVLWVSPDAASANSGAEPRPPPSRLTLAGLEPEVCQQVHRAIELQGFSAGASGRELVRVTEMGDERVSVFATTMSEDVHVWVHLSVRWGAVEDLASLAEPLATPAIVAECPTLVTDLGLLVGNEPRVWSLHSPAGARGVAEEIAASVRRAAPSYFARFDSPRSVLEQLRATDRTANVFCPGAEGRARRALAGGWVLGGRSAAAAMVREQGEVAALDGAARRYHRLTSRLGLPPALALLRDRLWFDNPPDEGWSHGGSTSFVP